MKHLRIVSVIAVTMLVMTAFGAVMMADDSSAAIPSTVTRPVNQSFGTIGFSYYDNSIIIKTVSGSIPGVTIERESYYGSSIYTDNGAIRFKGTPTTVGTYEVKYTYKTADDPDGRSHTNTITFNIVNLYVVSFETDNGTSCTSKSVQEGSSITLPSTSKSGYTFAGWYTAASGGTYVGGSGSSYTPTSSITLYARWTPNVVTYTVTFDGNGGTSPSAQAAESGKSVTLPSASLYGYSFDGWYTSASGGTFVGTSGSTYTPSGNITLYAHWTELTVSMSSISGTADIVVGSSATYTFTGTAGCSVSISGATWLTATSSGSTYYLTGVPTVAGVYNVTVTLSKSGYTSATGSISVKAVEQLTFLSVPTAGMIVNG